MRGAGNEATDNCKGQQGCSCHQVIVPRPFHAAKVYNNIDLNKFLMGKKMPHRLDAASFLNTKTMCLITNYYKKLTKKYSYGRLLITTTNISWVLVAERVLQDLILRNRHIHLQVVVIVVTIGPGYILQILNAPLRIIGSYVVSHEA